MSENLVPIKLIKADGGSQCQWMDTYEARFTEPFFDNTIAACRRRGHHGPLKVSGLNEIEKNGASLNPVAPAVIIFHLSRCGSTLITQMFATSGRFIVLSEVPIFDEIFGLPLADEQFDEASIAGLLSASLNFYGRKRFPDEEHVVLKTDCWHIFFYHTLRKMFPLVPIVIMYRRPEEVFRSLAQMPGRQVVPQLVNPEIFGFPGMPEVYQIDNYTAAIIEKMLEKFLEVADADKNTLLLNYNEGPVNIINNISRFARIHLSDAELAVMRERAKYHSKKPGEIFERESSSQSSALLSTAMQFYEKLELKRKMS